MSFSQNSASNSQDCKRLMLYSSEWFRPETCCQYGMTDTRVSYATLSTLRHFAGRCNRQQADTENRALYTDRGEHTTAISPLLLKRSRSAADKNDRYSFLKRGFQMWQFCLRHTECAAQPQVYMHTVPRDRSKHTRCQDRPAFETIFEFGPGGTRIATSL